MRKHVPQLDPGPLDPSVFLYLIFLLLITLASPTLHTASIPPHYKRHKAATPSERRFQEEG